MKVTTIIVTALAWVLAAVWLVLMGSGAGRNLASYTKEPLRRSGDIPIQSGELIWSGWSPVVDGYRLSAALRPDILFQWSHPLSDPCALTLRLFPVIGIRPADGSAVQVLEWRLNDSPWNAPLAVSGEQDSTLNLGSGLANGANVLTFRFPDARPGVNGDPRLLAIGVRRVSIDCGSHAADEQLLSTSFEQSGTR